MISVLPIKNRDEIQSLFQKHGLPFSENAAGVSARDRDAVLGYCLFDLTEKGILIRVLQPQDDLFLADGILRSALHIAAERSAMDARYADTAPVDTLEKLGFILPNGDHLLDIDRLFRGCSCEN